MWVPARGRGSLQQLGVGPPLPFPRVASGGRTRRRHGSLAERGCPGRDRKPHLLTALQPVSKAPDKLQRKGGVSAGSGGCRSHRPGLSERPLGLPVLDIGMCEARVPAGSASGEDFPGFVGSFVSLCPHVLDRGSSGGPSSCEGQIPSWAPPSGPHVTLSPPEGPTSRHPSGG